MVVESLERRLLTCADSHESSPLGTFPSMMQSPASAGPTAAIAAAAVGAKHSLDSLPALESLPSAPAALYLDFNGHFDSIWGTFRNVSTPVFDQDGDPTTFSDGELNTVRQVWEQVAEDFAPFNINVTTVEPASFVNRRSMRVAIGGDGEWLGGESGGVAYVDSFTNALTNSVYVFPKNLANGNARFVGEAASHEAGHSFGLAHQSLFSATGVKLDEYSPGSGDGRAPIMGNSYTAPRGLWWNGTDSDRDTQDDLSVIARAANGFDFRADDHADAATAATELKLSAAGDQLSGAGVIHLTTDIDYFSFHTGAGEVSLTVQVANRGNLNATLELRDEAGVVVASAQPTASLGASITTTLGAGDYYAVVASQGDYGDLGQYTVSGLIQPPGAPSDSIPPVISGIRAGNTAWSDEFLAAIESAGLVGLATVSSPDASLVFPWSGGIDRISVQFDSEVVASASDLVIRGIQFGRYDIASVASDPLTRTITWTLAQPIVGDRATFDLSAVRDAAGNPVISPATFTVLALAGDADRNGKVDREDLDANIGHQFSTTGDSSYDVSHDIDANGIINIVDLQLVLGHMGTATAAVTETAASAGQVALTAARVARNGRESDVRYTVASDRGALSVATRRTRHVDAAFADSGEKIEDLRASADKPTVLNGGRARSYGRATAWLA